MSLFRAASPAALPGLMLLLFCTPAPADSFDELVRKVSRVDPAGAEARWDDAGLAADVSDEAIDRRREAVIRFAPTDPYFVPKRKDPKYQNPILACRLAIDPADREALDIIRRTLSYRGKDDDFGRSSLAGMFCRHRREWSDALVDAIRRDVTSYDGFFKGGTENHIAMRRTAGLLFGEQFLDETFDHDLTGRQVAAECRKYIRDYGREIYATSQVEYLSPAYWAVNASAWLHVAEFARDDKARLAAQAILDYLFADLAINYSQGVVVPPVQREKGLLLDRYQLSYAHSQTQFVGWLFFGGGNTRIDGREFADEKYEPCFPHDLCVDQFAVSDWLPNRVIRNIAAKRAAVPYMLWQARGNWPCIEGASLNPYGKTRAASAHAYPTDPRYQLRSVYVARDYALGAGYFKEEMADPLLRTAVPFGVVWRTKDDRNMLLAAHPFWYTKRKWEDSDDLLGDEDWMGISPFCQTVHWENAALLLYDLPERDPYKGAAGKGSPKFLSERGDRIVQSAFVYFPESVDEKIQTPAGFFLREGDVYVAIRALTPGARWEPSRHLGYQRLAMPGSLVGCAIEVGDAREFGSFDAFQERVGATVLDTSHLADQKQVAYRSTRGHQLRVQHRPDGWLPEASVDGVRLDFDRWPTTESPYVTCRDRVLDVNDGHEGFTVDWRGEWPVYSHYRVDSEGGRHPM